MLDNGKLSLMQFRAALPSSYRSVIFLTLRVNGERTKVPLKGFICKTAKVSKEFCLTECKRRCLTLPTLMLLAQAREWKGKPSTTQLLNSYREAWLKIKKDYWIEPQSHAFALLGTMHHQRLEIFARAAGLLQEHLISREVSSTLDLLEPDPETPGQFILSDYKTWGSYSVQKWYEEDDRDAEYQLNHYRVQVERDQKLTEALGFPIKVSRMQLQVTIRDGGLEVAQRRKIMDKILMLEVPRMDDGFIINYFGERSAKLLDYVNTDIMPPVCDSEENWNWKKCKTCDVWESCPEGSKINVRKTRETYPPSPYQQEKG